MKYVLVTFPEIQYFMEHERWSECIFCIEIEGHPCPDSAYMVPEDLYNEVEALTNNEIEALANCAESIVPRH